MSEGAKKTYNKTSTHSREKNTSPARHSRNHNVNVTGWNDWGQKQILPLLLYMLGNNCWGLKSGNLGKQFSDVAPVNSSSNVFLISIPYMHSFQKAYILKKWNERTVLTATGEKWDNKRALSALQKGKKSLLHRPILLFYRTNSFLSSRSVDRDTKVKGRRIKRSACMLSLLSPAFNLELVPSRWKKTRRRQRWREMEKVKDVQGDELIANKLMTR